MMQFMVIQVIGLVLIFVFPQIAPVASNFDLRRINPTWP